MEISEGAAVWATTLRERSVGVGDRVVVVADGTVDSLEAILGVLKAGAVVVPCMPSVSAAKLERIVSSTDAALVVAENAFESTIEKMGFTPDVPALHGRGAAELEGRPRRRADARHRLARPRLHRVDVGCRRPAQGRRAHARLRLRHARPGRALARRRARRRSVVHLGGHLPADDVEHGHRAVVPRRGGGPPPWRVRRRRAPRPPLPARPEHSLPVPDGVPHPRGAPEARAIPLPPPPPPRLDRRLPRSRGRRGVRGAMGHDRLRRLRPGGDEHHRRGSRRRRREARHVRPCASRSSRRDHRRPGQRAPGRDRGRPRRPWPPAHPVRRVLGAARGDEGRVPRRLVPHR